MPGAAVADNVDHPSAGEPLGDHPKAVLVEVFLQRGGGGDRSHLDVRNEAGQRWLAIELDDQHAAPGVGSRACEDSRYRGLPDTPFAGDDHESRVEDAHEAELGQVGGNRHWISGGTSCADY